MKHDFVATIKSNFYRWTQRIRLFLSIVWRWHETKRLDCQTAWQVSGCFYGKQSKRGKRVD